MWSCILNRCPRGVILPVSRTRRRNTPVFLDVSVSESPRSDNWIMGSKNYRLDVTGIIPTLLWDYNLHTATTLTLMWLAQMRYAVHQIHQRSGFIKMTSSNGNLVRVTGPLRGEFTGNRWIPLTKASDVELWCFLWSGPWINGWVNNREAGDLRRNHAHYDVTVMIERIYFNCSQGDIQKYIFIFGWQAL